MIYVLTVRNKSGLQVTYKGTPVGKLVFEFAAPDSDVAVTAIRDVLQEFRATDGYLHRVFEDAIDDARECAEFYSNNHSGLHVDWKVVDGVN